MQLCTNEWQHYIQWHLAEESSKSLAIQGFLFQIHTFTLSHENHERLRGSPYFKTSHLHLWLYHPPTKKCLWFCWNKVMILPVGVQKALELVIVSSKYLEDHPRTDVSRINPPIYKPWSERPFGKEIILVRGLLTTDWNPVVFIGNGLVSQGWSFKVNIKYYTVDEATEEWFTMILTSEFCWPGPGRWLDVKAHHSQELQGHFPWGCTSSHCMIEANHVKADGVAWRPDHNDCHQTFQVPKMEESSPI